MVRTIEFQWKQRFGKKCSICNRIFQTLFKISVNASLLTIVSKIKYCLVPFFLRRYFFRKMAVTKRASDVEYEKIDVVFDTRFVVQNLIDYLIFEGVDILSDFRQALLYCVPTSTFAKQIKHSVPLFRLKLYILENAKDIRLYHRNNLIVYLILYYRILRMA